MGEIRTNPATGQETIYAPARARRPRDFRRRRRARRPPPFAPDCPFCPGNEALLPPLILETPGTPWRTRVVFNRYPAFTPEGGTESAVPARPARGRHEVIIETPRHDADLASAPPADVAAVLDTYHSRVTSIAREARWRSVFVFRNRGPAAGTSLVHPHSQLIAAETLPPEVRRREGHARRYFEAKGHSAFCDLLEGEIADGRRVVSQNESFVAFVPYAAEVPFEIWIMPKRHHADFASVTRAERHALAILLRDCLQRLWRGLGDPDYNYVIISASRKNAACPWFCWYLRVLPRLTTPAGFELGAGMRINPSLPERDADFLRAAAR